MKPFSVGTRTQNIEKMKNSSFDLVVIGGGITGAGIARDAASRGMSVALVEMNDFASGTSSRSSKLIHGGIRYLENLEFHLVYEALSERALLFELAPNLVHPLRFLLPLYRGGRVGMCKMGLGMWLYDILSLFEAPEMHERLSVAESIDRVPFLKSRDLLGSYEYSDAYMDDDRLVIETLRSANELGALCASYVSATGAEFESGKLSQLQCRDEVTGVGFRISGRHFVSTVGPWTDRLGSAIFSDWQSIMRPSKGIHLTLNRKDLPLPSAVVMASDVDKRIVFGIPRHEMVIIGTTDTDFSDQPETVHSTVEDVDYLLQIASDYFPGAELTKDKIIASYAGVRPLVHDGSATESATSREHVIINDPRNITFVAGGKYTTYRRMAEQTVESLLANYPLEDQVQFNKANTKKPLNPLISSENYLRAKQSVEKWSEEMGLSLVEMAGLVDRYGEEVRSDLSQRTLCQNLKIGTSSSERPIPSIWRFEVAHAIENTMCFNLLDFYLRRTPLFLSHEDNGWSLVEAIADEFAECLSWSDSEREGQIKKLKDYFQFELNWKSL